MRLHTIDTGLFKLDGGAMFGVVPKVLWNKLNPADEKNLCSWAMRCLLVEEGDRLILIDTGIGDKQDAKFFSFYDLHGDASLRGSLNKLGFGLDDITDVFLTHLHFDHVGGAVIRDGEKLTCTFPNAHYWTNRRHWEHALNPNKREKPSFLAENLLPIESNGQLRFLDEVEHIIPGFEWIEVNGHTEAMMLPKIKTSKGILVYMADLHPSHHHIPVNYVMGYDIRPLVVMDEKAQLNKQAAEEGWVLFYEHDPLIECSLVVETEKGFKAGTTFRLTDW